MTTFPEPGGTRPGTRQNVRLVAILLIERFPEPGGTRPGSRHPSEIPCIILYFFMGAPALIIILFKRAGRPPEEHLLNSIIRGGRVFDALGGGAGWRGTRPALEFREEEPLGSPLRSGLPNALPPV